ncbi:MAG: hypothetical protein E5X44_23070 [Mesorhizobium sp.]|nr:MAG: hypothetical protein E5X44_23070 [Mesorhizobium sp.]
MVPIGTDDPPPRRVFRFLKRVAFDRPRATRFRLFFMHVVIAKPLHTFARHALFGGSLNRS